MPHLSFPQTLERFGYANLLPAPLEIFQINVGKLCNMSCSHCHVDAGPKRKELMSLDTIEDCLKLLDRTDAHTVDITGGAPELNPHFRYLVDECVKRGKKVIDRCNLTVLLLPKLQDLPQWLADRGVEIVCSLPYYEAMDTDRQRGDGTFVASITALKLLNQLGYGKGNPLLPLTIVTNPIGATLPCSQTAKLQQIWQTKLKENYDVTFDRLITITNMPIARYLEWLRQTGNLESYMELLVNAFNPSTIGGLMCRNTISIGWDGSIYDCDFNQMLDLQVGHIRDFDPVKFATRTIVTGDHCFGCTAGGGSSCRGAIT